MSEVTLSAAATERTSLSEDWLAVVMGLGVFALADGLTWKDSAGLRRAAAPTPAASA